MRAFLLVIILGPLALPYHDTYAARCGNSYSGIYCGSFFVRLNVGPNGTDWSYGAALSFIFVVVFLTLVSIVVSLVFVSVIIVLLPSGTMALYYYDTSYYAARGGSSGNSVSCGVFCVSVSSAGGAGWVYGAAL